MFKFFSRTLSFSKNYNCNKDEIISKIQSFKDNPLCKEFYFDASRNEGVLKGKSFMIVYEINSIGIGQNLNITVTEKFPFYIPKMRANGFFQFIETTINEIK